MRQPFDHQRLDVYQSALRFVKFAHHLLKDLQPGASSVSDQLRRAASSIPLNIAEGAGEFSSKEKARFYRIAKRSTAECVGALDVMLAEQVIEESRARHGIELLDRTFAMLVRLIQVTSSEGEK